MYFRQSEHNPPHVHAFYGNMATAFDINKGEILDGIFPPKETARVKEWLEINREILLEIWRTQDFSKMDLLS